MFLAVLVHHHLLEVKIKVTGNAFPILCFTHSSPVFFHVDFQIAAAAQTDVDCHVCTILSGCHSEKRTVEDFFKEKMDEFYMRPIKHLKLPHSRNIFLFFFLFFEATDSSAHMT